MKRLLVLVIISLLVVGCDSGGDTPMSTQEATSEETLEGALPVFKIGDSWTYQGIYENEDIQYTGTMEVIGEEMVDGIECYVDETEIDIPLFATSSNSIGMIDKATLDIISIQFTIEEQGELVETTIMSSYQHSESPFPLYLGKTWETTERKTTTLTANGVTETETEENTFVYKIEAMETVTVPAGTFECFKRVKYSEDGYILQDSWPSETIKLTNVKSYDYEMANLMELISYSVSD